MPTRAWRTRICRCATAVALAAAALAVPAAAYAQVGVPSGVVAQAGETVRIRTAAWLYTGTLRRASLDTAVVSLGVDSAVVARSSIVRVDVQRGTRRSTGRIIAGSLIGIAAGGLIGGFAGVGLECGTSCNDEGDYFSGFAGAILGGGFGAILGGITGGVLGGRKRYPRWIPAVLPERAP